MKLTPENIEEQILLLVDGELEESAEEGVIAYIGKHPQYKIMLDAYLATQVQPDEDIVFPGKESLLRQEPRAIKMVRFAVWQKAAAVALILVAGVAAALLLQRPKPARDVPAVAHRSSAPAPIGTTDTARTNNTVAIAVKQHKGLPRPPENNNHPVQRAVVAQKQEVIIAAVPGRRKEEIITPIATAQGSAITIGNTPAPAAMIAKTETIATPMPEENIPKAWSPLKEETREGIHDLVAHFQTIKEEVQEKTQLLKMAANTIVFRFGDKEVALNK